MHFLITNDDGIEAPGLAVLAEVLSNWGRVSVVAPLGPHSGCGHRVTDHGPLRVERRKAEPSAQRFAVDGTPADCTRLGLAQLAPDADWVMAGINAGGNLGIDMFMSGTVAAAREAALFGRPAIALSQFFRGREAMSWSDSQRMARKAVEALLALPAHAGSFWNVNLPHLPAPAADTPLVFCEPEDAHHHIVYEAQDDGQSFVYRGEYQRRGRTPGRDVDVCFSGQIAISRVSGRPSSSVVPWEVRRP